MHPEIENLINMAIADGEVTEKERAIILRKAEGLGEDKDEVEMILDGKIALMKKEQVAPQAQQQIPKSNKEGEIKKCPSCGAPSQSFATKCPDCGHEFRNIDSSNSIKDLIKQLDDAEVRARNTKSGGGLVGGLMSMIDGETVIEKRIYESKSCVISTFPVPNTKEDILEFLALSVSQVNSIKIGALIKFAGTSGTYGYKITFRNAWLSIANKVIMKARFSMKDDKKTLEEIMAYAKELGIK
jgi:Zn finger protein HypA/HybF involved in hydrogenase expression